MNDELFEAVKPLFHNLITETPSGKDRAVFFCNREGCDFTTRYKMLEPIRHSSMTGRPLPRRMAEIGPRKGDTPTCYGDEARPVRPPFEPPKITPIGNMNDLLAQVCGGHDE